MNDEVLCRCGDYIRPTNWSMGPGWAHRNGESLCRLFARPADREIGRRVLAAYAARIGVPLRDEDRLAVAEPVAEVKP